MFNAEIFRPEPGVLPDRQDIPDRYKWDLSAICRGWDDWTSSLRELEAAIERLKTFEGTLAQSADQLLEVFRLQDRVGALMYKVWYFASLHYDEDQRNNDLNARRQQVQILFAKHEQATSWFSPELLAIPAATVRGWLNANPDLGLYRFAVESLYHQQEHVLDRQGERLLAYSGRLASAPDDAYESLTTADIKYPTVTLANGDTVTLTYGQFRAVLETRRDQADRAAAYRAFHETFRANLNTYAALYNGVLQADWFHARARGYKSALEAALHGNNIPTSVVENLIQEAKAGVEPLRRYHRLRRRILGQEHYKLFDTFVPLVQGDVKYPYDEVLDWVTASTAPLGREYQGHVRTAFESRWVDVFENPGKRSGAYSAPVYGSHPYMLLNYNETLDAIFTLAHEMGHSMHTLFAHRAQPFRYAAYEIFVAEVPSTLSEALFLDFMLARASGPQERALLLQHAIDSIAGTFFTQVLFADFELQAHRLVEQDQPVTADTLCELYRDVIREYYGDTIDEEEIARVTWARISHFFQTPYYVYQYSTCFASTAALMQDIRSGDPGRQQDAVQRYLALLRAGGSDYPIALLQQAGVDLTQPDAVRAVSHELDGLVARLEQEIGAVDTA
jgi:oligoendopeptidase F